MPRSSDVDRSPVPISTGVAPNASRIQVSIRPPERMRVPSNFATSPLISTLPRYWAGAMTVTPRTCTSFHSSWAFWVTTS